MSMQLEGIAVCAMERNFRFFYEWRAALAHHFLLPNTGDLLSKDHLCRSRLGGLKVKGFGTVPAFRK